MALHAIKLLKDSKGNPFKIKIVVPTSAIAKQWKDEILKVFPDLKGNDIGLFGDGKHDNNLDYMIYIINSACQNLAKHVIDDFKNGCDLFLICDECHHYNSFENKKYLPFILI